LVERTLMRALALPILLPLLGTVARAQDDGSPGDLYRQALLLPPVLQRKALVEAAGRGSVEAAGRMIELGMWDDVARINPQSDEAEAWAGSGVTMDGMTAAQIHDIVLANWGATRGSKEWADAAGRTRSQIERGGVASPFVANALARLYESVAPKDLDKAQALRHELAQAFEARAARSDPIVRGACLHAAADSLRPGLVLGGDWLLAAAMYGRAVQAREAVGDVAGSGDSLFEQAWCLCPEHNPSGDWLQAAGLFARSAQAREQVGDLSGCARSLYWQALCLEPAHNLRGDWNQAAALYARSAALREQAGEFADCGKSLFAQAQSVEPANNPSGSWAQAVELLSRSAAMRKKGGDMAGAGKSLTEQAWCLQPTRNPAGDWSEAAKLAAEAARLRKQGGDLEGCGQSLYAQASYLLHDGSDLSEVAAARAVLVEAREMLANVPGSVILPKVDKLLESIKGD